MSVILQVPAAIKLLYQSIVNNVNGFCKCNFSVSNANVICYDITRVTLRGTVEAMQLPYVEDWVLNMAKTIDIQGVVLTVDNGCEVEIQSLDDPECPLANGNAQQVVEPATTGFSVGFAVAGVVVVAILVITVVVILFIRKKVSRGNHIK